ncbi:MULTISPECIES: TetR/AcrR family transcriptional regulator [Paenibacillus]|uniref:TetR/AcrR family transcriptional regulator n=1 Tax=Paenibacillus baimaensis TaxID=2982185 RepID=A0ABT2UBY2_9BACL|nr:TetR/AcrR family transcriptional regulator [Paenibacillus sp. WQ 127069]MCU6792097.1 TetR/AcrR family transcriptional regulator [Paenibacillus sp. WQ 127069]
MSTRGATKELFLSTSIKLFIEHGFDQVTINQICKEMNVTKTAFYYYFKSKDELISGFFSVDNLMSNDDFLDVLSASDYANQAMKAMEVYIKHIVSAGVKMTKEYYRVYLRNEIVPLTKDKSSLLGSIIPTLIQRAKDAGQVKNAASAEDLHDSMCYIANGICLHWAMTDGGFDVLEESRRQFENLLIVK